ncbi:MAG TPA: beta-propeller domain-containing protein, partial [Polyangiales bacterium]
CGPGYCGGYGSPSLKITVADVSVDEPKVEREIYYEGSYLSSRRYGDVVRAVIQSYSKFSGLFSPQIQWSDAWGRPYDKDEIASQLEEWEKRTEASIRNTKLGDWFPVAQQVVNGKLVDIAPSCESYFVPDPGLADYGLTHVLSLDTASATSTLGGVTIVGAVSTVYSNAAELVLAQPDYRWNASTDFGVVNNQQTAYHVFALDGANTRYAASGWLFGTLPANNPQFGIDVAGDGTLRVAATGWVRDQPDAKPDDAAFWNQHTENRVLTAKIDGGKVVQTGQSEPLGHKGETVQSARFIGERGYVVTYRQTDPLIVLDVASATPKVLGEIEIPGFSQYVHPLDATHLITVGQSGKGGTQLQLFDVTNPAKLPAPKTLDFGVGSSSEASYNHKAFTAFEDLLALPMYGQFYTTSKRGSFKSTLEVLRVNATTGFSSLASIDHSKLYADNGVGVRCGYCDVAVGDAVACYDYACSYQPELRRGHFVKGEDGKVYVYSFSYAGVLVHALSPTTPVASVGLPAPVFNEGTWYGGGTVAVPPVLPTATDGGVAVP